MPQRFRYFLANTASTGRQIAGALIGVVLGVSSLAPPVAAQVPFDDAVQVANGAEHSCALRGNGTVWCWGRNIYGQLGDGTTTSRNGGVQVLNLIDAVEIAVGAIHSCARTSLGAVFCWGGNFFGRLGDGTTINRSVPTAVLGMSSGATSISAGRNHTCAVLSGAAKCWGANSSGALGDGTTTDRLIPTEALGLTSGIAKVSAGAYHSCALSDGGGLLCWGGNNHGQLGDGTTTGRLTPLAVSGLGSGVAMVSAGASHSCAALNDGSMRCWGKNNVGQIGDGTTTNRLAPVPISGIQDVSAIAAGANHTCAISQAAPYCWGENQFGQLGDGGTSQRNTPAPVFGETAGSLSITAGETHSCHVAADGRVRCWGSGKFGQLGDDLIHQPTTPTSVAGLPPDVVSVGAGGSHSCALTLSGDIHCWGGNVYGQLGDGTRQDQLTPVAVTGLPESASTLAVGQSHTCAVTASGAAYCWGDGSRGQLGNGYWTAWQTAPTQVLGLNSGVSSVSAGFLHSCALMSSGAVYCWGTNSAGMLGDGTTVNQPSPVAVAGLAEGAVAIALGGVHTCALTTLGGVKCWGANWMGQLGDGTTTDRYVPTQVSGLASGVVAIAAGESHTCATLDNGSVMCWGSNEYAQMGYGYSGIYPVMTPGMVTGLATANWKISAGYWHTCVSADIGTFCWGRGSDGQLGHGSFGSGLTPVSVSPPLLATASISAGYTHTCATTDGGEVSCWGGNYSGQTGIGIRSINTLPSDALFTVPETVFADSFE